MAGKKINTNGNRLHFYDCPVYIKYFTDMEIKHMDRCCGSCIYSSYDSDNGYMCVNDESEYCTDFVEGEFCCIDFQEKEQ